MRLIGLCSNAPGPLGKHGIVFSGGTPGIYTVYLHNLRIRHANGSSTVLWSNKRDTRTKKAFDTELFKDLQVQTVDAGSLDLKGKR